jgi:uncharacterized protein YrrD
MLRSIVNLCKDKLSASDGELGHVNDFYFDDQHWAVRYVVADTGSWMSGRLVLISPRAFGKLYQVGDALKVNLTRKQIEESPSIDSHKPVSRQYEEEYHKYYGWPYYWQGGMMWGVSDSPFTRPPEGRIPGMNVLEHVSDQPGSDPHLRSAKAVIGHHIQAADEVIGHVSDFVIDDANWAVKHMVVDTKNWLPGKRVLIAPNQISKISWDESKVYVNLTREAIIGAPIFDPAGFDVVNLGPRISA